ncbi:unnamed protein product [Dicrocoelium dendriticum]|nr:unnamed protein product [Dicrocoelium dendriticum]
MDLFPTICSALFLFLCWRCLVPLALIIFRYTAGQKLYSKRKELRTAGEWAIITGGTDGIGRAFAEELASDGLSIMLISRNVTKLESVSSEIKTKYNVPVRYIVADFTQVDIYESIRDELSTLSSIACLINNVGMVNVDPVEFALDDDMRVEKVQQFLACNCLSAASLTHIVLPRLVAQNSGSAVINVSSFSGCTPLPYLTLYGATKAFVRQLSCSLEFELRGKNIIVQTLAPMYVATSMVRDKRGTFIISPRQCAKSSLDMLGVETLCMGHIIHALQIFYFSLVPQSRFNESMLGKLQRARIRKSQVG